MARPSGPYPRYAMRSFLRASRAASGLALLLLPAHALAQGDEHPELGRFSTGPPVNATGGGGNARIANVWLPDDQRSTVDGSDIRANQVLTSAQNETSMAVDPLDADNWIGTANDYSLGTVQIGWYTTLDGGQTWTTGTFGIDPGFSFSGDPCVTFGPDGTAHVIGMMYSGPGGSMVTHFQSTDKGLTWTSGQQVDLNSANDKPQAEADLSASATSGHIAAAWDRFGTGSGDHVYVSTSSDGGATWSTGKRINDNTSVTAIAPDVCWGNAGELYVAWADRGQAKRIWIDRSLDGGTTFGTDVFVAPYSQVPSPIPGSSFRMFDIFAVHADQSSGPFGGNVYVAYHTWNTAASPANADIRVATSSDRGATWGQNVLVNDDGGTFDQVFPGICVDPGGAVNVAFFDRRLDPNNYLLWTWVGRSTDGGATFANYRASDVGWNHAATEFAGTFIGDYSDVDCDDRDVLPFWVDGRTGGTQDVYVDRLNLQLHTDVLSVSAGAGGAAQLLLDPGPNYAGMTYLVVAGASGTSPGVVVDGVDIPLNPDAVTDLSQILGNTAFFQNTLGVLDATGSAVATFSTNGPRPFLSGMSWDWVAVVIDAGGNVVHSTAPTHLDFTP